MKVSAKICAGTRSVLEPVRSPVQRVSNRYLQECLTPRGRFVTVCAKAEKRL
jgi:hypothetical protein